MYGWTKNLWHSLWRAATTPGLGFVLFVVFSVDVGSLEFPFDGLWTVFDLCVVDPIVFGFADGELAFFVTLGPVDGNELPFVVTLGPVDGNELPFVVTLGSVDGKVVGCVVIGGVGCPVTGLPTHVFPSDDMFMPLGQRQVCDLGITASKHRWLQPPLFAPHVFEPAKVQVC